MFTVHMISLKNQDHPFGENESKMQNLVFSLRRHWTSHLTAASLEVNGYADTLRKVIKKKGAFDSVRGFHINYICTEINLS